MMRKTFLIALLLCLLPACRSATSDGPLRLRVLSYNIHHGEGVDGVFDYERLADIIKRADPDLVALQEVDRATGRSSGVDQAATLAELTGMHPYFAEAMPYDGGSYGEAILSKTPINTKLAGAAKLKADEGQEPRVVALAAIQPDGLFGPFIVFAGTHLCHQSGETRLAQVGQINEQADKNKEIAMIIAGDFNFTPGSKPYQAVIDAGWVDAAAAFGDAQPTIPSNHPRRRIDYVFVRPAERWRVIDVKVLHEPVASDHAPLLVELEYVDSALTE